MDGFLCTPFSLKMGPVVLHYSVRQKQIPWLHLFLGNTDMQIIALYLLYKNRSKENGPVK